MTRDTKTLSTAPGVISSPAFQSKPRGTHRENIQNTPALAGKSYNRDTKGTSHFPEHQPWNGNTIQSSISDKIPDRELMLP